MPLRTKRSHLNSIIQALSVSEPRDKTDMFSIFRAVAETYPRRGMMILISDLLADRAGLVRGLKLLRQRGHDVMVFHVMDDDELDFPFTGPDAVRGPGDGRPLDVQSACVARRLLGGARRVFGRGAAAMRFAHLRLFADPHQRPDGRRPGPLFEQSPGNAGHGDVTDVRRIMRSDQQFSKGTLSSNRESSIARASNLKTASSAYDHNDVLRLSHRCFGSCRLSGCPS